MRCPFTRLTVGLLTFLVGIGLASFWVARRAGPRVETYVIVTRPVNIYGSEAAPASSPINVAESSEEKAVRLAEEFVMRNGYTDVTPDRNALSYESIEGTSNIEDLLEDRRDTLERRAYGVKYGGRPGVKGGWIVVFRYRPRVSALAPPVIHGPGANLSKRETGRAVTMDGEFKNLRVEHQDFFLDKVDKRL